MVRCRRLLYGGLLFLVAIITLTAATTSSKTDAFLVAGATPNQGYVWVTNTVHGNLPVFLSYRAIDKLLGEITTVACRMLGLPGHPRPMPFSGSLLKQKSFTIKHCHGNETSLYNCSAVVESNTFEKRQLRINCGRPSVNVDFLNSTNQSSTANGSSSLFALDANVDMCFSTKHEENPWIELRLQRSVYIHKITITTKSNLTTTVKINNVTTGRSSPCNVTMETDNKQTAKCVVDFKANVVRIGLPGMNKSMSLCRLDVAAFDSFKNARGICYRNWEIPSRKNSVLKLNIDNTQSSTNYTIIPMFDFLRGEQTGIIKLHSLSGYLLVSRQGRYILGTMFKERMEMWIRIAKEPGLNHEGTEDQLVTKLEAPVGVLDDESQCHLYHVELLVLKQAHLWNNFAIAHMKYSGETNWHRFFKDQLYWMRPGFRVLHFDVTNNVSDQVERGSHVTIEASYKFCCSGMICPSCPISMHLQAFGELVMVNQRLLMNCYEHHFTYEADVYVKPANYSVLIIYSFVGDFISTQHQRTIRAIQVTASKIYSCSFGYGLCKGWKLLPCDTIKDNLTTLEGGRIGIPLPGNCSLESPWLPWKTMYSRISFCVEFSYLLLTNTTSSIDVYIVTSDNSQLLWSMRGFQGNVWGRAGIPVSTREAFQIVVKGNSLLNDTTGIAVKQFDVTTEECRLHPYYAKPGYSCKVSEFKCSNGQCVSKTFRCNAVQDGCLDGSDEDGCDCPTGYFRCSDGKCIKTDRLCNGAKDCQDGMDEHHCGKRCPNDQCLDGSCSPEACNSKTGCEDNSHRFTSCRYCSNDTELCRHQPSSDLRCQALRGLCGFENGPCKLQRHTNSSLEWNFFSPALNQPYNNRFPRYDHTTMTEKGNYFLLRPNTAIKNSHGSLLINLFHIQTVCLQFWFIVPSKSNSLLEVMFENSTNRIHLWRNSNLKSDDWTFGQVEIPHNSTGKLLIVGYTSDSFVALDDVSFTAGHCKSITNQENPSCYFDNDEVCNHWMIDNAWKRTRTKIPEMLKHFSVQDSSDTHLTLSQSLSYSSTLSSPMISPQSQGWQCFRFWFYSGKKYFDRSLSVSFLSEKGSKEMWKYNSANDKWKFIQFGISKNYTSLKVVIRGRKYHENAILAVDNVTFFKEPCHQIPVQSPPCQEYQILDSKYRRLDLLDFPYLTDTFFGTTTWYRVAGSAGNQAADYCNNNINQFVLYVWIKGPNPTVKDGEVQRQACLGFSRNKICCYPGQTRKVLIRNCGGFFVYQFPDQRFRFSTFLSSKYIHKTLNLSIEKEWQDWITTSTKSHWMITSTDQYNKVKPAIQQYQQTSSKNPQSNDRDFGLLVNGNASIRAHIKRDIKNPVTTMTICLWVSINSSSSVTMTTNGAILAKIGNLSSDGSDSWKHLCVSWKSDYGLWQVYIDGTTTRHGRGVLDKKKLDNAMIAITFTSNTLVKVSRLNIWDRVLTEYEILYTSYECGQENGTYLKWSEYRTNISAVSDHPIVEYTSSCTGKQGNVLSVVHPSGLPNSAATILSPRYERSSESPGRCLRFRYKMWGPGAREIKIYQKLDDIEFPWRPIWMDDDNGTSTWREGQVTLTAVTGYKLIVEGHSTDEPGLISIGALYSTDGYCDITIPVTADRACSEVLTNTTGYIMSPYYPGYYPNNANCTWTIKAKKGHVIRLEINIFELEMSPRCSADSVEIYDGEMSNSLRIGRYCGVRYPPVIQSSFNTLYVRFTSNDKLYRNGFLAKYRIVKDSQDDYCVQDCPSDCVCRRTQTFTTAEIIISSQQLRSVPDRLPKQTSLILFSGSDIFQLETESFYNLDYLVFIDLSFNKILKMEERSFVHLPSLEGLRLNRNFLRDIGANVFVDLPKLKSLDLGENLISHLDSRAFLNLTNLRVLGLRSNMIEQLDPVSFETNKELQYLYLHENHLENIPAGSFLHQKKLKTLKLHGNKLQSFSKHSFEGLGMLETLTLHNNTVKEKSVPQDAFDFLVNLKHLTLDSFILCCYAKKSIPTLDTCQSPSNGFSSCEDMLKSVVIQLVIWIQGIIASFGNLVVIIWWAIHGQQKTKQKGRKFNVQSFLLSNLALADLLMGIYLLFIAIQHTLWEGEYFKHDVRWRSGIQCQIAGAISTLSSEVSVMVLVAITTDRANSFLFEFSHRRLSLRSASIICLCIWVIGFVIAFIPLFIPSYFKDQTSGFSFYGRSTVCLPLQLSEERPAGWEYSIAVFNVFNGVAFVFILVAYIAIFLKVKRSARNVRSSRTSQSSLGKRLAFVILTDFCCWMPVVILGVLSLTGNFQDPTGEVYAWIAVLVLPINSSINPILYTFSTPQVTKKLQSIRTKWQTSKATSTSTQGSSGSKAKQNSEERKKINATTAQCPLASPCSRNEKFGKDDQVQRSIENATQANYTLSAHAHENMACDTKL